MTLILDEDYHRIIETLKNYPEGAVYRAGRIRHRRIIENDFPIERKTKEFYRLSHETILIYSSGSALFPSISDELSFRKLKLTIDPDKLDDPGEELLRIETRINFMGGIDFRAKESILIPSNIGGKIIQATPRRTTNILDLSKRLIDPVNHARTLSFDVQGQRKKDVNSYESF